MTASASEADFASNPLTNWAGPYGLPAFEQLSENDFAATIEAALVAHEQEIEAIAGNPAPPDIENTLAALELSERAKKVGRRASRCRVLQPSSGCGPARIPATRSRRWSVQLSPRMSRHFSAIHMNEALFARIDALFRDRDTLGLDAETARLLEKTWKRFVKAGAKLGAEARSGSLYPRDQRRAGRPRHAVRPERARRRKKDWVLFLEESDLVPGCPDFLRDAMRGRALSRGQEGRFAVTLSRSTLRRPFHGGLDATAICGSRLSGASPVHGDLQLAPEYRTTRRSFGADA